MATPRMPTREALEDEVSGYIADFQLAMTAAEIPANVPVPAEWRELLQAQSTSGVPAWPRQWDAFADELPAAQQYLREALCGVAVLVEPNGHASLLYVATIGGGGAVNCYRGWPPVSEPKAGSLLAAVWRTLPHKLRVFYSALHDGWTELASDAGGPARSTSFGRLSDPDWDLDASALHALPCKPADVLLVFSNAAGDYLALDTSRPTWDGIGQGIIWLHDDPAHSRFGEDFWGVLNAWSGIFFEETDRVAV